MRRRYIWSEEFHLALRRAYASRKAELSVALDDLERLTGFPRALIKHEAGRLGLRDGGGRRPWTPREDRLLVEYAGEKSKKEIARLLNRGYQSVSTHMARLRLSSRLREGYTFAEAMDIFGVARTKMRDWMQRGLFGELIEGRISDEAMVRFCRRHYREYSFRTTNEDFLKGVLFGAREAVARERAEGSGNEGGARRGRQEGSRSYGPPQLVWSGVAGESFDDAAARAVQGLDWEGLEEDEQSAAPRLCRVG